MTFKNPHQLTLALPSLHADTCARARDVATTRIVDALGLDFSTLRTFPNISSADASRSAVALGNAGEALVESWAWAHGLSPLRSSAGTAFDHVFAIGSDLVRVQTKATSGPSKKDGDYHFRMQRGNSGDPHGTCQYPEDAYELAALVFLDKGVVYFTTDKRRSHRFTPDDVQLIAQCEIECFYDCLLRMDLIDEDQFQTLTVSASPLSVAA